MCVYLFTFFFSYLRKLLKYKNQGKYLIGTNYVPIYGKEFSENGIHNYIIRMFFVEFLGFSLKNRKTFLI